MAQAAQTRNALSGNWRNLFAQYAWGIATIFLLIVAIYYQVLIKLVTDWWQIPDFSYGFLVPLFAVYLVWEKERASSWH